MAAILRQMCVLQLYFDFISFSQFAAISNEIKTGQVIFQVILAAIMNLLNEISIRFVGGTIYV